MLGESIAVQDETTQAFDRGIDRESARTDMRKGGYEAAQNILLASNVSGGKHPVSMKVDTVLDPTIVWPAGNPTWCAPFTYSTYDATNRVLSYSTHLVIHRDSGQVHRYDAGSPGTSTNIRRGFVGANRQLNHYAYDKWLCTVDGRNAPMKYGQHFLWNGQLEPTPFLYPLGSRPVSPLQATAIAGESWVQTGGNGFRADGVVPMGARVGDGSLLCLPTATGGATSTVTWTYAASVDLTKPPQPYGGDNIVSTDFLVVSFVGQTAQRTSGSFEVRFRKDATNYFKFTFTPNVDNTAWSTFSAAISTATTVGAPVWTAISSVQFINNDPSTNVFVDDLYFLYRNAPPAGQVATSHKNRIVMGGAPVGSTPGEPFLSTLVWSNTSNPDNFPSSNTQNISGGFESLAKSNTISALREYQDSVIIGTPQAIFAWTVGDAGLPAKSTISTEHGIDSHRGVVETPNGSLLIPWQRGYYILRSTGRQFVGAKIQPILASMALDDPTWTMAVIDEDSKTARIWMRQGLAASSVSTGVVFDYVRAQEAAEAVYPSTMTQMADWAVPAFLNGARVTLTCRNGDPQIRVLGQGTGTLQSSVTLPWMAAGKSDHVTKWLGCTVAYASTAPVGVYIRYANNPGEFDGAQFTLRRTLPANPTIQETGQILLGGTTRWAQVKFQAESTGFELFPPVHLIPVPTERRP